MFIEIDEVAEDLDLILMSDRHFYNEVLKLLHRRKDILYNWPESSKVAKVFTELTGRAINNAYHLDDIAEDMDFPALCEHVAHESGACYRVYSMEQYGIDHRYCLCKYDDTVHVVRCRRGLTSECEEENIKIYTDWRTGGHKSITSPNEGNKNGDSGSTPEDNNCSGE